MLHDRFYTEYRSTEDMLAILFPHMFEDLEYLIPEEYGPSSADMSYGSRPPTGAAHTNGNAIAGPSRRG
jgi:E3 ubiquitin-protein ligase SHPRH